MGEKRMKTVYDIMQEKNADFNRSVFMQKQQLPYEAKVTHAKARAIEFYNEIVGKRGENVHVSVGGLDSITLLMFLRKVCHLDVPAISVSSLEDKSIQAIHRQLGVETLKPLKSKVEVLNECGFPVLSKEIAGKIKLLQNPSEKTERFAMPLLQVKRVHMEETEPGAVCV